MSTVGNALSGLVSAATRLATAAENISKSGVEGRVPSGRGGRTDAYTPKDVIDVAQANGGVLAQVYERSGAYRTDYKPESPKADKEGNVLSPDVNVDEELVNSKLASLQYGANAKVIKAQLDNEKELFNVLV